MPKLPTGDGNLYLQVGPFVFFAVMMTAQFFVVLKFYPETARIRLEEIEHRV